MDEVHALECLILESAGDSPKVSACLSSCTHLSEEAINLAKLVIEGRYVEVLRSSQGQAILKQDEAESDTTTSGKAHLVDKLLPRIISFVMGEDAGESTKV